MPGEANSFARFPRKWNAGFMAGLLFLLVQVFLIIEAQFGETRHFCWAPHTEMTQFSLHVEIDGKALSEEEVIERYQLRRYGWEAHAIHNVFELLVLYEQTHGVHDNARLTMDYSVNGNEWKQWRWPEQ